MGRSNGNGRGPVQTAPKRPQEREVASREVPPRYPIPDPPTDDEEDLDDFEDEVEAEDELENGEGLDEEPEAAVGPGRELPPILPKIDPEHIKLEARRAVHLGARHAVRVPTIYLARVVRWAPVGIFKALVKLYQHETDVEGRVMVKDTVDVRDHDRFVLERKDRREEARTRRNWFLVWAVVVLVVFGAGVYFRPIETGFVVAGLLWLAAWYGAPRGAIVDHIEPTRVELRRWDTWVIREAFEAAKLSKPDREGFEPEWSKRITFVSDPRRDGPGTSVVIDLAKADTPEVVMERKPKLASGLSVTRMQIEVTPDEESERRIELFIHDKDPTREPAPLTPLAEAAKWDFWEPVPFGITTRGDAISVDMLWGNMLVGSQPRVGKSFAARQIVLAAALDPYVRLYVFNGRPDGAWSMFEQVAHRYGKGERDDVIDLLIASLEECVKDYERRSEHLGDRSKTTKAIARNLALNMPLTLFVVDEFHLYIGSQRQYKGRQTCGQRILELLKYLVKVGGATGYMLILATQKPDSDLGKGFTGMRDNMTLAYALAVRNRESARAILGEVPVGLNPAKFSPDKHKGVGVLIGGRDESGEIDESGRIVRTYWCEDDDAKEIAARAAALRGKAGTLTGHAAGEKPVEKIPDWLLDHILETAPLGEDRLVPAVVLDRLQVEHPEIYSGWSVDRLRQCLRDLGVKRTVQINRTNPKTGERESNVRGFLTADIEAALSRRTNGNGNGSGS